MYRKEYLLSLFVIVCGCSRTLVVEDNKSRDLRLATSQCQNKAKQKTYEKNQYMAGITTGDDEGPDNLTLYTSQDFSDCMKKFWPDNILSE